MLALRTDHSPELIDGVVAATQHRDREDIERSLVELVLQFLEADTVALFKVQDDGGVGRAVPCITATVTSDNVQITRDSGEVLRLAELPGWRLCLDQRFPLITPLTPGRHETVFPVIGGNDAPIGVLRLVGPRAPDARELYVVGGILQIIRNHLALIDYGERDTLTGLLNRKTFESEFEKLRSGLVRRSTANPDRASWVGLVDIDRFKSVNDRFGHVFGDEVLLLVSQITQRTFRGGDRIGGEEFAILLQDVSAEIAAAAFERLRLAIAKHPFPQVGRVTVSLGWTRIRSQDTPTGAIERADRALYHAKNHGRNRIANYDELVADGEFAPTDANRRPEIELF
jgi:diguanylate cyclase (GGDEF)-like protein